jgi:hypothetical protein
MGSPSSSASSPDAARAASGDAVTLPASVLDRYRRFTLYNSPYPAHDAGHAIDLYLDDNRGLSPVAGVVRDTRTVTAPSKPYAVDHDHLIVVDVDPAWARAAGFGDGDDDSELVARVLHVDPGVDSGERVAVGDSLGQMVRSGFFAPWVDNHVHLGFRRGDQNPYRASGSLRIEADIPVAALPWDGTGRVAHAGETYVVLDAPAHPAPGERFVAVGADDGRPLDGGLPHYDFGGVLAGGDDAVSLLGTRLGAAADRTVAWEDLIVTANGDPITGLSLFVARDAAFGAKLVCPGHEFAVGDRVEVALIRDD